MRSFLQSKKIFLLSLIVPFVFGLYLIVSLFSYTYEERQYECGGWKGDMYECSKDEYYNEWGLLSIILGSLLALFCWIYVSVILLSIFLFVNNYKKLSIVTILLCVIPIIFFSLQLK